MNTMKKTFPATAYDAYDFTADLRLGDLFETIPAAEEKIRLDDKERSRNSREYQWIYNGLVIPYKHHEYGVIKWFGDAEIDVEDEEEEPSFSKLCEAVKEWKEGDYCEVYRFKD